MRSIQEPTVDIEDVVQPVAYGGTGSNTKAGAAAKLKLVSEIHLDAPNGVAKLGVDGKTGTGVIPDLVGVQRVNIKGSRVIAKSVQSQFTISDYDAAKTYDVSVSAGQVVRNGKIIYVTAPATTGPMTLTVNSRAIALTVVTSAPGKPQFYTPNPAVGIGNSPQAFFASDYTYIGSPTSHFSSYWQVATDNAFANIVSSTADDTTNKTTYVANGLLANTRYYARVAYKDSNGVTGEWSDTITFKVRALLGPNLEETYLYPSDVAANQSIGAGVSLSDDGKVLAVGSPNNNSVYIFRRLSNRWTMEQKIFSTDTVTDDAYGAGPVISGDGLRLVVPAANASVSSIAKTGAVYIYVISGGLWTLEQKISAGDKVANDQFGRAVSITADGSRIAIGADQWPNALTGTPGKAYVFSRSGSTWTQEAKIVGSDAINDSRYGSIISISRDGVRVAVTAIFQTVSTKLYAGAVYVYSRSGTTWSQEQKITASTDVQTSGYFGSVHGFSQDHTRIFIGEYGYGYDTAQSQRGRAHVWLRTGSTWAVEQVLNSPNPAINFRFGITGAISANGATLYIGETRFNAGIQGYVHIFKRVGSVWTFQKTLVGSIDNPTGAANFGGAVALSFNETFLAIAATNGTTPGQVSAGRIYIFN